MSRSDSPFSVLFVCTGNICRSPQAERLFIAEMTRFGISDYTRVSSAGTSALQGRPIEPEAASLTEAYGGVSAGHSARRLAEPDVAGADLVLTMERGHRADVVRMLPRANRYAFTLREFERLIVDLEKAGEVDLPERVAGPAERLRGLIPQIAARRGMLAPVAPQEDEVEDPYRRTGDAYARSARQVASSISVIANKLVELAELRRT